MQVSNEKVPKDILRSLSHLTRFLSDTIDDKNEPEKEMIDAVSRFNEERRKTLIILKSPLTTTTTSYPDYIDDDLFSKDDFDYDNEDDGVTIPDYYQYAEANQRFRFSFKQQQVQPPLQSTTTRRTTTTTTRRTTSTSRPSRRPETTTSLFVDTPFRLKLDPVSGLFKTVKDNGFLR